VPAGGRARELEWIAHDLEDEPAEPGAQPAEPGAEPAAKALGEAPAVRSRL
jgi:hypothetical protein